MPPLPYLDGHLRLHPPEGVFLPLFLVFLGIGALCLLFAGPVRGRPSMPMALHVGGGLTAVLAGDLITLLIGWELLSFSAFFMIVGRGGCRARHAALRYLRYQIVAAAALFVGMAVQIEETGMLDMAVIARGAQPFVLMAVAVKTAAVPFHGWLTDGYAAAPYETVPLLSVYATKVGVFTAARLLAFPVTACLGGAMALLGVVGALRQDSGRRLLSFHIISQVGYMVAGVGLATELGVAAGIFHAVNHIAYKALLFMVMGAVCLRVGHDRLRELGGLARAMPLTCVAGIVASASISGVPPFNGFASKELISAAAGGERLLVLVLSLASLGTGLSFIKFMVMIFLRPPLSPRQDIKEAPMAMLVPMGLLALFCAVGGLFPARIVPHVEYAYYTAPSLGKALLPLAGSVVLWRIAGNRLMGAGGASLRGPGTAAVRIVRRLRAATLASHRGPWQPYLAGIFLAWILVVWLLVRA